VREAAAVTKLADAVLLEVEALPSRWWNNRFTFRVLELALVAIAATARVAEGAAHFGHDFFAW